MGLTRQSAGKFIQEAIKEEGSLRKHYSVPEGKKIPVAKARADYKRLQKESEGDKTLSPSDKKLFDRLHLFLKVLKPAAKKANNIPGGLADDKKPSDFDSKQLQKGTEVEKEHTEDPEVAKEIAMDHLTEDPEYYKKLETIERHAMVRQILADEISPQEEENRRQVQHAMAQRSMSRTAKANITPIRQTTQYGCVSASMGMALRANGVSEAETQTDIVNKILGALPGRGASWEDAIACAQHYGMRATLVCPSTVTQLKNWTDAGTPVLIGWNPEGRPWSHASVVFHVDDDLKIYIADPNMPHPGKTVRVLSEDDFYSKWAEKTADYIIRRPALAIEREITPDGRQVFASLQQNFAEEDSTPSYEDVLDEDLDNSQLPGDGETRNRKAVQLILRGLQDV